jgi:hypothetical protein
MQWTAVFSKLLDPYDLKARLFPGLLVLMPVIAFIALNWGSKHPVTTALASIMLACGGPYALASAVRTWGQRAQARLYARWGSQPSTLLLRHRNVRLAKQTKALYHELSRTKLQVHVPTEAEEAADPVAADGAYEAVANALRPLTNDKGKFPFIFKELVQYGFNRNAYGVRWVGAFTSVAAALVALLRAGVLAVREPYVNLQAFATIDFAEGLTLALSAVLLLVWLFHFTPKTVEQSGYSYALRLYEALNRVTKIPDRGRTKKSMTTP